ncbi:MAG: AMP-binding protein [Gammaproteobacteria bacterium]|nr:AMP-binding protein [Gammaproteobacteria bacterium]
MTLIDFFDRGLMLNPHGACLVEGDTVRSYEQVAATSHRIAAALLGAGLGNGAHAAVYSPNMARVMECILGILRAGAVWLPVNARNALEENLGMLRKLDCACLFYHSAFEDDVTSMRSRLPDLKQCVCLDRPGRSAPFFEDWIAPADVRVPALAPDPDGVPAILPSGGTTGAPKGVVTTNRGWELMVSNYVSAMPFEPEPVQLVAAPLSHGAGAMCFPVFAGGGTTVVMAKADPLAILEHIPRRRVTRLYLPPTLVYMLLAEPRVREFDYSSLRYFLYAAAPMAVEKLRQAMTVFGPVMCQAFGQAEALVMVTFLSPGEHAAALAGGVERRLWSCGRPTLTTQVAVMGDDGGLLGPDAHGEIVIRSAMVMKEYYRDPEATQAACAHGWHHTGDIGCVDQDGYVYIVDRKKDMVISGGFNVYPSEVEQVIMTLPAVRDCAVIGVPDEKWGEAVKAVVQLEPGATASEHEVIALCKARLGGVKAPRSVEFWTELPRSPVGKVLKKEIRRRYWADALRQVN